MVLKMKKNGFSNRLEYAANTSTSIPDHGFGRQVQIAKALGVSQEAVRKWFAGESSPRHNMMKKLANLLDVNYVWLALGNDQKEIAYFREVACRQDAAVYAFVSYLMNHGFTTAFPSQEEMHDVTAIRDGKIHKVCLYSVVDQDSKEPNFKFKKQPDDVKAICAVSSLASNDFELRYTFFKVAQTTFDEYLKNGFLYNPLKDLDLWGRDLIEGKSHNYE